MREYNGFSPSLRREAARWGKAQDAAGRRPPVTTCMVCGQRQGKLMRHSEDYSKPFEIGKTGRWELCYRCHMTLHLRFRFPDSFDWYRRKVTGGARYPPMFGTQSDFGLLCAWMAKGFIEMDPLVFKSPGDVYACILRDGEEAQRRANGETQERQVSLFVLPPVDST